MIYTTSAAQKDKDKMMQLGAVDYVVKQADFLLLKETLRTIFLEVAG